MASWAFELESEHVSNLLIDKLEKGNRVRGCLFLSLENPNLATASPMLYILKKGRRCRMKNM